MRVEGYCLIQGMLPYWSPASVQRGQVQRRTMRALDLETELAQLDRLVFGWFLACTQCLLALSNSRNQREKKVPLNLYT